MEQIEVILNTYYCKPYRPEFLLRKIQDELKYYNFTIIEESKKKVKEFNYNTIFKPIFGSNKDNFNFTDKVSEPISIENFKNVIYENCKLNYQDINKKEIVFYLFILKDFKKRIINAIYNTGLNKVNNNKFEALLNYFLLNKNSVSNFTKQKFDQIYFSEWMKDTKKIENSPNNDDEFNLLKIQMNYKKYEYYGPDYDTFVLNGKDKIKNDKIALYSPDYLIDKKIFKEYNDENFQIFNENNDCPQLFSYMLHTGIKELNKKIKGEKIDEDIVDNIGIINFNDKSVGIYLNMTEPSRYYEMQNLIEGLTKKKKDKLNVVLYSDSAVTKQITTDNFTKDQQYYMEYNAHVNEEQLSHVIVNSIGDEILNQELDRLPRVIFYFNLYVLKSLNESERIAFTAKGNRYGFEEADGVFYSEFPDIKLNKSNIPFLKIMRFTINEDKSSKYISYKSNPNIIIKKNSLIYMEVKTSFPLKTEKINNREEIKGINETKYLIKNIIRKSNKFSEIAKLQKKDIKTIHILFMYDTMLQKEDDIQKYIKEFINIFKFNIFEVRINTIFDVVYFVNPASINIRKLSDVIFKLKEENKKIIEDNSANQAKINEILKENKNLIEEEKSNKAKINEILKENKNLIEEEKSNKAKINEIQKENKNLIEDIEKAHKKINEFEKDNIELNKKIKELEDKINSLISAKQNNDTQKKNTYEINNRIQENKNIYDLNSDLINEDSDIFQTINESIKNAKDVISDVKMSNDGTIYLMCRDRIYIIKKNSYSTLEGYNNVILPLKNGDLVLSKFRKIFIYLNNNFDEAKNIISMKSFANQIIELSKNSQLLFLSENSEIILIKKIIAESETNVIYKSKNITSMIQVYDNEIAIIFKDRYVSFFDLEKKEEIKKLELVSNSNINLIDNSYIFDNCLYIALLDSMFEIDIKKKELIKRINLKFSKIYRFKNNFGINGNCIYQIIHKNNQIENKLIYKDKSKIIGLYQIRENIIIIYNENKIKFLKFN